MATNLNVNRRSAPGSWSQLIDVGLATDVEIGELAALGLCDAAKDPLLGVLRSDDTAVVGRFRVSMGIENGDDGFFFMDVESDVECLRRV